MKQCSSARVTLAERKNVAVGASRAKRWSRLWLSTAARQIGPYLHFCGLQAVRLHFAASTVTQVSAGGSPNALR
jgi:hypothetical protein